jgi:hypothetical protein
MDFPYLAKVTRLNVRALDALANAPLPPAPVAEAAVQTFTAIEWQPVSGAAKYRLYNRRTDQPYWQRESMVETDATRVELLTLRGDDWLFGVSSVSAEGVESPVASAVPGGAFVPLENE